MFVDSRPCRKAWSISQLPKLPSANQSQAPLQWPVLGQTRCHNTVTVVIGPWQLFNCRNSFCTLVFCLNGQRNDMKIILVLGIDALTKMYRLLRPHCTLMIYEAILTLNRAQNHYYYYCIRLLLLSKHSDGGTVINNTRIGTKPGNRTHLKHNILVSEHTKRLIIATGI